MDSILVLLVDYKKHCVFYKMKKLRKCYDYSLQILMKGNKIIILFFHKYLHFYDIISHKNSSQKSFHFDIN